MIVAGRHLVSFDAPDLTTGLYFYTTKIDIDINDTKKSCFWRKNFNLLFSWGFSSSKCPLSAHVNDTIISFFLPYSLPRQKIECKLREYLCPEDFCLYAR